MLVDQKTFLSSKEISLEFYPEIFYRIFSFPIE